MTVLPSLRPATRPCAPQSCAPRHALALSPIALSPIALSLVALSLVALLVAPAAARASVHHAVAPVHRAAAAHVVAPSHGGSRRTAAMQTKPHKAAAHATDRSAGRHAMAEAAPGRRGKASRQVTIAEEPSSRHAVRGGNGRAVAEMPSGKHLTAAQRRRLLAEEASEPVGRHPRKAGIERAATERSIAPRSARAVPSADREQAADRSTEDRIHAWYRQHGTGTASPDAERQPTKIATVHAPAADLATTPQKATTADFDRAAAAQRQTIRSQAEQNSRQTTAADDAADAATHIPSTAPTAREPLPFVHGDAADPSASGTGRRGAAPVVRQRPEAQTAATTGQLAAPLPAPGAHRTDDPRVAATRTAQPTVDLSAPAVLGSAAPSLPQNAAVPVAHLEAAVPHTVRTAPAKPDAVVLGANPMAPAASSRSIRALAAETASEPTPRLQLPAPATTVGRKPAIGAVQAGNAHPVLDPAVTAGMADETFDGDDAPATANTAIRLATRGVHPHAEAADDSGPVRPIPAVNVLDGQGHLLLLPPMKGTHEILVHQNQMAVADGLERIANDRQLDQMRRTGLLVALPDDDSIYPNDALPLNRRFARPWTVRFLRDIARAHYQRFGTPLIVTSAVRTVEFQRHLVRVNGNAAPPTGDIASPHLYGQAIDFAKRGMSLTEITWMRAYLTPVESDGKIDVEEEFQQACFHISVYRRYLGMPAPRNATPQAPVLQQAKATPTPAAEKKHHLPTALLATHLP